MEENQIKPKEIHQSEATNLPRNSYSCHNEKCNGVFVLDGRTQFVCERCKMENSIDCLVIHEFQTCDENKRTLTLDEESEAKASAPVNSELYATLMQCEEDTGCVLNTEPFDCPICILPCDVGAGVILRDCLHIFCFDCIRQHILHSTEVQVKCPQICNEYSCDSYVQDREVRTFVNDAEYQKILYRSLALAELTTENTFHCLTPDCKGWCIMEDGFKCFACPVCGHENCLDCETIHNGETCDDYLRKNSKYTVTQANKMSEQEINGLVAQGLAMRCPKCEAVIEKIAGCDGMTCSICKTALCWATKGARWGPNGVGDNSGGCQCGVRGKCDPKCLNCH